MNLQVGQRAIQLRGAQFRISEIENQLYHLSIISYVDAQGIYLENKRTFLVTINVFNHDDIYRINDIR
jgi:hypothetical protein